MMVVSVGGGHGKEYCVGYSVFFLKKKPKVIKL